MDLVSISRPISFWLGLAFAVATARELRAQGFLIRDTTRRDMVFDFAGQNLYYSTSGGSIKAFQLPTLSFGPTYNLGGSVDGIDIARDNSFLLAAQDGVGIAEGAFQRINLVTGAITNVNYTLTPHFGERGAWDVAIGSNGFALATIQGEGWVYLRQINPSTNAITVRSDLPDGVINSRTQMYRSANGTRFLFIERYLSPGEVFTYSAATNTFGPTFYPIDFLDSASGAVNRTGSLIGFCYGTTASLRTAPSLNLVHSFDGIDSGVVFDAVRDVFYGVNSASNQIIAYSTTTYAELFRLTIGENVSAGTTPFGTGTLVASPDGHWLALETNSGIRLFRTPPSSAPFVTTDPATYVASYSATLKGTVYPEGLATTVYFQYGTTTSYGSTTASQNFNGSTPQSPAASISGLSASTTYHYRIVAHNSGGTVYGGDRTFTTLSVTGAPVGITNPATYVLSYSATLNGALDPHGLQTSAYFQYGTTTSYSFTTSSHSFSGNTYQNVAANIGGLSASTTYHFRIVATNSAGTVYGADKTFVTLSATGPPLVTTNPATFIASYSATLNSTLDPHGLSTTVYFQYGTTTSYGSLTPWQIQTGDTYRNISMNISGLSASTTYHFRIVATNSTGTVHGADQTFTTLSATGPPVVITNPATNLTSSSATLNGKVDPHGLTTSVHFQYGTTTSYGSTTPSQSKTGNTYQTASANISGLSGSTTYHFRLVATNSAGTVHGADRTFTTP